MTLSAADTLKLALDPGLILRAQGMEPDPWQQEFLLCPAPSILLNCSRGAGKSRTTSALAVHTALFQPGSLILLVSRAQRQAQELLRYCKQGMRAVGWPVPAVKETETVIELANGSRIVSLPGKESTIRSYQGVALLILDEAARVPDDLYKAVTPMVAVSHGRKVGLSTPFGQRGWFWREWHREGAPWTRFRVPWQRVPRHDAAFIANERTEHGDAWVEQEYECSFASVEGVVYPDFELCRTNLLPLLEAVGARPVGGLDWGWNNPFAALWGFLSKDDVLYITHERYLRQTPLHEHIAALKKPKNKLDPVRHVTWYADPSGPVEIAECRAAGLKVLKGINDIRAGIAAVTARIRTGRLKVLWDHCPMLVAESQLYRYPRADERVGDGENPVDDNNHALGALRYLVSKLDRHFVAKFRRRHQADAQDSDRPPADAAEETQRGVFGAQPEAKPSPWGDDEHWETLDA